MLRKYLKLPSPPREAGASFVLCAACLEPGEAGGSAGGTAEAWRFWIFPDLDLWSFPDLCRAGSTAQVLFGKENRLQLCSANMQTSTVKGGRIISADGS